MALRADPNSPLVLAERCDAIRAATGPLIQDRCAFLAEQVAGLDVLDVGCVNHSADTSGQDGWLHAHLVKSARTCLGVDILEADVRILAQQGYTVKAWDVTETPLPQRFDVIVCGELIEHVGHVAGLFANCHRMLRPGGKLFVSTPNPWFVNYIMKAVFSRKPILENVDHVAWFEPCVMTELATRHHFQLSKFYGIQVTETNTWKAGLFFRFVPMWRALGFRPELFAKSILYEFRSLEEPEPVLPNDTGRLADTRELQSASPS